MTDPTRQTLGQLLAHSDPTVKRGAMGILKQLQRLSAPRAFQCYQEHRTGKYAGLSVPHVHEKPTPREGLCDCGYPCVYGTDYCERHQTP